MTTIRYKDGQNEIYNEAGKQAIGSVTAGMEGLNPRELLEAALGLCVSITLAALFKRDGIPIGPEGIDIKVTASKAEGITNRFTDFKVAIEFPDLEPAYKKKAILVAERGCTIGNTLINGANVVLEELEQERSTKPFYRHSK